MPKNFEVSGPAFVSLLVRNTKASAEFYEKQLGFRRDPEVFPTGIGFLTYPVPFGLIQASPSVDLDSIPRPITTPTVWFKTADSQVVHDALVEAGVTILRAPWRGRGGLQFTFVDPDGYAINIYDRDAPPDGWDQTS
jgi:predicted enzyme related to lactoylglutathione lyase